MSLSVTRNGNHLGKNVKIRLLLLLVTSNPVDRFSSFVSNDKWQPFQVRKIVNTMEKIKIVKALFSKTEFLYM